MSLDATLAAVIVAWLGAVIAALYGIYHRWRRLEV